MKTVRVTLGVVICVLAMHAGGATPIGPCSIHPKKGSTPAQLRALAKITENEARKAALGSLKDPSKGTVREAELESEKGCLVYSFDIAVAGASGVQEVLVDAGDGQSAFEQARGRQGRSGREGPRRQDARPYPDGRFG